jgi:hypothetical protein
MAAVSVGWLSIAFSPVGRALIGRISPTQPLYRLALEQRAKTENLTG